MWSTRWSESLLNISDYDGEERRERSPGPLPHQWGFVPSPWSHIAQLSPERAVATHTFRGALLWFVWVQMKKRNKVKQTRKQHVNRTQSALHKLLRCVCLLCIWYIFKSEFKWKHLSSCCWLKNDMVQAAATEQVLFHNRFPEANCFGMCCCTPTYYLLCLIFPSVGKSFKQTCCVPNCNSMESVWGELLNGVHLVLWLELFVHFLQILLNKAGLEK